MAGSPIYCTESSNDADLRKVLGAIAVSAPIPNGDCCWFGVSDGLGPVPRHLVERKRIGDMANSVLSGRYLQQARSARVAGFWPLILVVEGQYRPSPEDGILEIPAYVSSLGRGGWKPTTPAVSYSRFDTYLSELSLLAGILVKRSRDVNETAAIIKALWQMSQKPSDGHRSLHTIYVPPPSKALLAKPGLVRRVAKELDGIGWERSDAVARRFSSVREMVDADIDCWLSIEGIGKGTAERAVRQLSGYLTERQTG